MVRDDSGVCHLFYSRWPKELGFNAWVTHSEIARATSAEPLGPYRHVEVVLPARGASYWDGHCTHNPNIHRFDGRYFLYYMGNRGDRQPTAGLNFSHRNNQRIGVASAPSPAGPWMRQSEPLIAPSAGGADALCCTNPTVCSRPAGGFLMIFKGVGRQAALPFGGPVVHLVATASAPTGPFAKLPTPIFTRAKNSFPGEDPFLWSQSDGYHVILKDNAGAFAGGGRSLVQLDSADGLDWDTHSPRLITQTQFVREDGSIQTLAALERPQVWLDGGEPAVLFCAASIDPEVLNHGTFNVAIPIVGPA